MPNGNEPPVWMVRPGKAASLREVFQQESLIAVSQANVGDLTGADESTIVARVERVLGGGSVKVFHVAGMLRRFAIEMQIGDWILVGGARDGSFLVGVVSGDYAFEPLADDADYAHTRRVRWLGTLVRDKVPSEAIAGLNAPQALFQPGAQAHLRFALRDFDS